MLYKQLRPEYKFAVNRIGHKTKSLFRCGVIHTFMKFIPTLFALSLLLTACTTTTSDTAIRRQMVGVWSLDSRPGKIVENKSDGTIVVKIDGVETANGTWRVENGYMIEGPSDASSQASHTHTETNKVLRVSGDKEVLLSIDGHTQLTFHRQ
jgi:hypothetical protein